MVRAMMVAGFFLFVIPAFAQQPDPQAQRQLALEQIRAEEADVDRRLAAVNAAIAEQQGIIDKLEQQKREQEQKNGGQ